MDTPQVDPQVNPNPEAEKIIRNHVWFAALPGFAPLPVIDIIAITGIQIDMIKQLCQLYNKNYDEQRSKAITTALVSTLLGRMPAYALRTGLKVIPGLGWILGGLSIAFFAGASTYATGMVFKEHFEQGGTLNDLKPESLREFYRKQFQDGWKGIKRMWTGE